MKSKAAKLVDQPHSMPAFVEGQDQDDHYSILGNLDVYGVM